MNPQQFVHELNRLLRTSVAGMEPQQKVALIDKQLRFYETNHALLGTQLSFVPFIPGRRPSDESLYPGLGSSEEIGLLSASADEDHITFLYQLFAESASRVRLQSGGRVVATLFLLDHTDSSLGVLPGWDKRPIVVERVLYDLPASGESDEVWAIRLDVNETFAGLRHPGTGEPLFGFASLFYERFRLQLELEVDGVAIATDSHDFEIYDEASFGSLYQRVMNTLLPSDMEAQQATRGISGTVPLHYHPWMPVLVIGLEKANLYMRALHNDIVEKKKMLTNPGWLLRVGLYLELLTCLGIFEAVREDGQELLSPEERAALEHAPRFASIREHLDVSAWREVWAQRFVAFAKDPDSDEMPVSYTNLLKKKSVTLAFLHAHHEDLKWAIALAGPNLVNAQETWHRVFRDAERAVLTMNQLAFPELAYLPENVRHFVLWHQKGFPFIPGTITGLFGDQDAMFPSAARQYRASMNYVAQWAAERHLMEFSGKECVPASVSLLESYMSHDHERLNHLQHRDGYQKGLAVQEQGELAAQIPVEEIARVLEQIALFRVLTEDERAKLAHHARPIELGPMERIIVQGNKGSSLFILHQGELEVVVRDEREEKQVATLTRGAVVGEFSFLTSQPRTSTVRATDFAHLIEIAASHLKPIVEQRPAILEDLSDLMVQRQTQSEVTAERSSLLHAMTSLILGNED